MKWHDYEDKINLYLDRKWSRFVGYVVLIFKKVINYSINQAKTLASVDFKAVVSSSKSKFYNAIHFIQEHGKHTPSYLKTVFLNFWRDSRKVRGLFFLTFALIFTYLSQDRLRTILDLKQKVDRSPASIERNLRPAYYNQEKKQITIYSLNLPILTDENKKTKSILVDFTVQLDTRISKVLLENLHHELNDLINMNTSPIVKDFPMTIEGKTIIKNKLIESLNTLLNKKDIKSEVKDIHIVSILSS